MSSEQGISDGVAYPVQLGESLLYDDCSKLHTLRYNFVPASVSPSMEGSMTINANNGVQLDIANKNEAAPAIEFRGKKADSLKTECVLVFDPDSGAFNLERQYSSIKNLTHRRVQGNPKRKPASASISRLTANKDTSSTSSKKAKVENGGKSQKEKTKEMQEKQEAKREEEKRKQAKQEAEKRKREAEKRKREEEKRKQAKQKAEKQKREEERQAKLEEERKAKLKEESATTNQSEDIGEDPLAFLDEDSSPEQSMEAAWPPTMSGGGSLAGPGPVSLSGESLPTLDTSSDDEG